MEYKNPKQLRIVYMGTPDFAVAPLKALVESGHNIVAVITMPDKPAGRGLKLQESAVKKYAVAAGLPVFQPEKLKAVDFVEQYNALNADLGIVVAFRMLPEVIFSAPKLGTFNLHASLLPQYRGAAPINWAIINGESHTGVTTFFLNSRMDEGAIIDSRQVDILPKDTAGTLHDKLMKTGSKLVIESVELIAKENFTPQIQSDIATDQLKPAPKIFKDTCHIDLAAPGISIINLIRGLSPYPAAWANLIETASSGETIKEIPMKIYEASFESSSEITNIGEVLITSNTMRVSCSDGYLIPTIIQPAGKQRMNVSQFLNGFKQRGELLFK